jgi:hypothetical protein
MNAKKILAIVLLLIAIGSVAYLIVDEATKASTSEQAVAAANSGSQATKVIAYYFHRTRRCVSCLTIERYSAEAIQNGFGEQLKKGRLEWRPVNVEEEGNEHFEEDFALYSQSLILVEIKDGKQGRWKNLEKIWELMNDKESFTKYVQDEIREYVGASS